ncbi:hypothetical protein AB0383_37725 [Amycolatopsis sp. NPDC051373]|uniref:hypothetical protein n=1 Tax=Amycolatopsis sp. NPDC051373 TaxID=3155801 RepID=UPI00344B6571
MPAWTRIRPRRRADARAAAATGRGPGYALVAGWSGILFAALFTVALVLVHRAPGLTVADSRYANFYADGGSSALVTAGLYIVPFAGIVFLWHMMATREYIASLPGAQNREMPRALQLASGVAFIILLFSGMALTGAIALLKQFSVAPLPPVYVARALTAAGYGLVFVFGARVAGMYMITTTTLLNAAGVLARPLVWFGYLCAAAVLLSWTFHPIFALIFPGWVFVVGVVAVVRTHQAKARTSRPSRTGAVTSPAEGHLSKE